ncbi:LysM peptidoglycan-binding domain-containing protein [Vibrio sp. 10N]|uniref:LysM peptidoglycan-binding domain-containing protein n=1 Tax=Vibrio sp. 10N TaxID=3058938 RepID=UPI002814514A|nr:LysM peptidoglycan-binding domain-containing protein [Vibrio sp. 10N]
MKQGNVLVLRVYIVVLTLALSFFSFADNPLTIKETVPAVYQVKQGDTLWGISSLYLHSPWRWPELWSQNRHIGDPDLIYPGDKLMLTWVDGQPRLVRKATKKLSPTIQVTTKTPIAAINALTQARYTQREGLVLESDLASLPKVIGSSDGLNYVTAEDDVYIDYQGGETEWAIYRASQRFAAPQSEYSMQQVRMVAIARSQSQVSDVTTLKIERFIHEIKQGDVAIPLSAIQTPEQINHFQPHAGPAIDDLSIAGMMDAVNYAVRGQAVVLNRGYVSQVEQGSSYSLVRPTHGVQFSKGERGLVELSEEETSLRMPTVEVGQLVVIRSYPFFSIAVIIEASEPITQHMLVISPSLRPNS